MSVLEEHLSRLILRILVPIRLDGKTHLAMLSAILLNGSSKNSHWFHSNYTHESGGESTSILD